MTPERSRVVLVTGAGSGIGRAVAEKLAKDGERVVVNDLNAQTADEVVAQIKESGGEAAPAPGDVSDPESVRRIVEASHETYGLPDILVNNAGFLQQKQFVDLTVEDFDRMIAVHLRGTFLCTSAVLSDMLSRGSGIIVNIASQLGQIGGIELCHYSTAKAGIIGLTKSLARGPINTELVLGLSDEWRDAKAAELPLGRFGEPWEVAETVAFLVSDGATLYVGQTLGPNSGDVML